MVEVRVGGVARDAAGQHVILLKPIDESLGDGRLLPIWIGEQEATSILVAVEGASVPRPLAHDLMRALLESVGAEVVRVDVVRIDGGTFYAEITLSTQAGTRVVDARPSDAVALASRVGAPIGVADDVMDEAGMPDMLADSDSDSDSDATDETGEIPDAAEVVDEFKRFLDDVDPEEFRA